MLPISGVWGEDSFGLKQLGSIKGVRDRANDFLVWHVRNFNTAVASTVLPPLTETLGIYNGSKDLYYVIVGAGWEATNSSTNTASGLAAHVSLGLATPPTADPTLSVTVKALGFAGDYPGEAIFSSEGTADTSGFWHPIISSAVCASARLRNAYPINIPCRYIIEPRQQFSISLINNSTSGGRARIYWVEVPFNKAAPQDIFVDPSKFGF